MALYRITIKQDSGSHNGVKMQRGMSVELVCPYVDPINNNGRQMLLDAFAQKYGKALADVMSKYFHHGYFDVKKL